MADQASSSSVTTEQATNSQISVEDPTTDNQLLDREPPNPSVAQTKSPSSASAPSSSSTAKCANCSTLPSEEKPLKPCTKCQSTFYCSRTCQKTHFKTHKKECARLAQAYALTADLKPAVARAPKKEGFRGGLQKWQFDT